MVQDQAALIAADIVRNSVVIAPPSSGAVRKSALFVILATSPGRRHSEARIGSFHRSARIRNSDPGRERSFTTNPITAVSAAQHPFGLQQAIDDYAIIGDCRTAALIAHDGSIGWLCLPDFSSPSVFGSILDREAAGSCWVRPRGEFTTRRRYLDDSPILETTFETSHGSVRLTDLLPVIDGVASLQPMRELLRIVEAVSGDVDLTIQIDPRPDYGRAKPRVTRHSQLGWSYSWSNELLSIRSEVELYQTEEGLRGNIRLAAGDRIRLSLSYVKGDVGIVTLLGRDADERYQHTLRWWQGWAHQCHYSGSYREAVMRSALTLKLLSFSLSGAIVAAPTTSLPEAIGGQRNWDYRYCWLRDAGLTMQAFIGLGFHAEARGFMSWLLHATRLSWPELKIMYDVYGRTRLRERELGHLEGYRCSRPVRIGNGAYLQRQLDVYGEVLMAADAYIEGGGELEPVECRMLAGFGKVVCKQWRAPDQGIWETRGPSKHFTFSKVMCWLALDRLLKLDEKRILSLGKLAVTFQRERDAIADVIEQRGFNSKIGSYTTELDGSLVDGSLLLMSCVGYLAGNHPRMISTYRVLEQRLAVNGLFFRYEEPDNKKAREGAFGICGFWAAHHLACRGDVQAARQLFEHLLGFANDVGLFGEEIEPQSGAALGNFPQAFTHIGLINAALAIDRAVKHRN